MLPGVGKNFFVKAQIINILVSTGQGANSPFGHQTPHQEWKDEQLQKPQVFLIILQFAYQSLWHVLWNFKEFEIVKSILSSRARFGLWVIVCQTLFYTMLLVSVYRGMVRYLRQFLVLHAHDVSYSIGVLVNLCLNWIIKYNLVFNFYFDFIISIYDGWREVFLQENPSIVVCHVVINSL